MTSRIAALADPTARAAAEAARQQGLRVAANRMLATKAKCALTLAGSPEVCGEPAVGVCDPCRNAFCEPHQSQDIGRVFLRAADLCWECQKRLVDTSVGEHDRVARTIKAWTDRRRRADLETLRRRRRLGFMKRWDTRARRSISAAVGLALVIAGGAAGLRVDDVVTEAGVPIEGTPLGTVLVTPFLVVAGIAVLAGLGAQAYAVKPGAAAAWFGRSWAIVGFCYLTWTLAVLLSRSRGAEFDWLSIGCALGGASAALVGAHLAHRPAAEVTAEKSGKPQPPYRDLIIAVAVVALLVLATAATAYLQTVDR